MASLKEILQTQAGINEGVRITLGSGTSKKTASEVLLADLRQHSKNNERYFIVCVIMVVALFFVMIGVALTQLSNPDTIKVVMAAFGGSATLLISRMFKMWREKSYTDCVIMLVPSASEETLKTIVEALVKRL